MLQSVVYKKSLVVGLCRVTLRWLRSSLGVSLARTGSRGGCRDESWVDGDALGTIVGLVDADQPVCQLEHVGSQRDDDELGGFRPLCKSPQTFF